MIKTKHGSRIDIVGLFPAFNNYERVVIEFYESGYQTFANVIDLKETKPGEIDSQIEWLEKKRNEIK